MTDNPSRKSGLWQVGLMVAIIVATILLGFFMVPDSREERDQLLADLGTINHGRLLSPVRAVDPLELRRPDGTAWDSGQARPKWRVLIPVVGNCGDVCRELLFSTRQVHIRLGKNAHRLERLYVTTDAGRSASAEASFSEEHPYLEFLYTDREKLVAWLAETGISPEQSDGRVVLVDPRGDAMMVYGPDHDGGDLLEDLEHLLKFSAN